MSEYEIEDNVPIPGARHVLTKHSGFSETFNKLKPGQSFFVKCAHNEPPVKGVHRRAKEKGWSVIVRTVFEDGEYGSRIWRIE